MIMLINISQTWSFDETYFSTMFVQGKLTKKSQRIRTAKSSKSATKRKVEVATSPTRKKRKSPDEANCEGLADGNAARSYRHGAGQWMLRIV